MSLPRVRVQPTQGSAWELRFRVEDASYVLDRGQPVTFGAPLGFFGISHFLMSAAKPSCSAFLMASDRIDPAGNFSARAGASDDRVAQS